MKAYIFSIFFILLIGFGVLATPNKTEASFWDYFTINLDYDNYGYGGYNDYYYGNNYGYDYGSYYGYNDGYYGNGYVDYNTYYPSYDYNSYYPPYVYKYPSYSYGSYYNPGNSSYSGDLSYPAYGQRSGRYNPCSSYCGR